MKNISVLFICMGNICRSPTAEAVFRQKLAVAGLVDAVLVDSAGTHAYHIGNPPDARSTKSAALRGYNMDVLRARQAIREDIERFDYVLAMDRENLRLVQALAPAHLRDKPQLLMSFAPDYGITEVPDPYYGGDQGFEQVLDMIEAACAGLIQDIQRQRH
jgi:protein-tyrosine phosphatase